MQIYIYSKMVEYRWIVEFGIAPNKLSNVSDAERPQNFLKYIHNVYIA